MTDVFYASESFEGVMSKTNAGGKARSDMDAILADMGIEPLLVKAVGNRKDLSAAGKVKSHFDAAKYWKEAVRRLPQGSTIVIQLPSIDHTAFFGSVMKLCRRRGVKVVIIVHDLDTFRMALTADSGFAGKLRIDLEDKAAINGADVVIVHNPSMRKLAVEQFGISDSKLVTLGIFDYLSETAPGAHAERFSLDGPVVVAGNLSREKAAYLYQLPADTQFALYGVGVDEGSLGGNVAYRGVYPADELTGILSGSFGLVWDGTSAETCAGEYGAYLKINNPHKASLYLASGMPLVVWDQSALAPFVRERGCGICVSSLSDLRKTISKLGEQSYARLTDAAASVGRELVAGQFTRRAMAEALNRL